MGDVSAFHVRWARDTVVFLRGIPQPAVFPPNTGAMSIYITPENKRKLVKVMGREDLGEIVHPGHNFGSLGAVYCVGVHFPLDGFCGYYSADRVTYVTETES